MKRAEFNSLFDHVVEQLEALATTKGADYAGDLDVAANFKRQAANLGLTPEQIWAVYASKHWDALMSYCKNGKVESEPIESRIHDIMVYCLLILAMIEDKKDLDGTEASSTD